MSARPQEVVEVVEKEVPWKEFLEHTPPEANVTVTAELTLTHGGQYMTERNSIQLYCDQPECESVMWFDHSKGQVFADMNSWASAILHFTCRHCKKGFKAFAIYIKPLSLKKALALKVGEYPSFGQHTPSRVIALIGPDRELFLKGRRAENRGLGIGAYAYYRRVVENQKNRIVEEILKVANKVGAKSEVIDGLTAALKETQFSTAVDSIKAALPESLLIGGHNPLKLLHTALSKGMHEQDDAECLDLAQSIRIVLTELAERIQSVLKEQAELKSAVSNILRENSRR